MNINDRMTSTDLPRMSIAEVPVTSVLADEEVPVMDRDWNADEEILASLGYKYEEEPSGIALLSD